MKPRLLDLFAGAGGAAMGYHRAGFDVTGVDIEPRADYPFPLIVGDAMTVLAAPHVLDGFAAVHASPPCQSETTMSNRRRLEWPDLLTPTLAALQRRGGVWVVENVPGARRKMPATAITLHGGLFGLRVDRPRLFASSVALLAPTGPRTADPVGVYGARPDGRRLWTRVDGSQQRAAASLEEGAAAMGIDWMTDWRGVAEAIPPAYTEFIGAQLLHHVEAAA